MLPPRRLVVVKEAGQAPMKGGWVGGKLGRTIFQGADHEMLFSAASLGLDWSH